MNYDSEENRRRWMWMTVRATPVRRFLDTDGWCDAYLSTIAKVRDGSVEYEILSGNAHDVVITSSLVRIENDYDESWQPLEYSLDEFETLIRAFMLENDFLQKEIHGVATCDMFLEELEKVRSAKAKSLTIAGLCYSVELNPESAIIENINDAQSTQLSLDEFERIIRRQVTRIEK